LPVPAAADPVAAFFGASFGVQSTAIRSVKRCQPWCRWNWMRSVLSDTTSRMQGSAFSFATNWSRVSMLSASPRSDAVRGSMRKFSSSSAQAPDVEGGAAGADSSSPPAAGV